MRESGGLATSFYREKELLHGVLHGVVKSNHVLENQELN